MVTPESVFQSHYDELRRLAERWMCRERGDHTLQATALVHEAFLRLQASPPREGMPELFYLAAIARAMRQVLVSHARGRSALKRTPGGVRVGDADDAAGRLEVNEGDVLALEEALGGLERVHERSAQVVELKCFGGMSTDQVAAWLGVGARTVQMDWRFAKSWLADVLGE